MFEDRASQASARNSDRKGSAVSIKQNIDEQNAAAGTGFEDKSEKQNPGHSDA